jgi:hypothetical protein
MAKTWLKAIAAAGLVFGVSDCVSTSYGADPSASLKSGHPELKSAGALAFGPDGVLFVGDSQGASLFAIDTGDRKKTDQKSKVEIKDLAGKIASMLGTKPQQILINDMAVNPISGNLYVSVSRGRGPDAAPVIVKVTSDGKLDEFRLEDVRFARADVPNPPSPTAKARGESLRNQSITDLAYIDGRVFLAGLSNEEFSSRLIAIPYPFSEEFDGAAIEIYHGAHGRFETKSPVRTFVAYHVGNEPHLLAAYTCTPLVKVPVSELKAGSHVRGTTIAELGNRNRPLDMVVYQKDGKDYLLLTNSSRGVMKIPTEGAATAEGIVEPVKGTRGLGYDTIAGLTGVEQLDKLDDAHAVILSKSQDGTLDLSTIELP